MVHDGIHRSARPDDREPARLCPIGTMPTLALLRTSYLFPIDRIGISGALVRGDFEATEAAGAHPALDPTAPTSLRLFEWMRFSVTEWPSCHRDRQKSSSHCFNRFATKARHLAKRMTEKRAFDQGQGIPATRRTHSHGLFRGRAAGFVSGLAGKHFARDTGARLMPSIRSNLHPSPSTWAGIAPSHEVAVFLDRLPLLVAAHAKELAWAAGLCLAFAVVETVWPGGRRTSLIARLANFRIAIVLAVALILLHPALNSVITLLNASGFERGLIGWFVPGWKQGGGFVWQLVIAVIYGFIWDLFQYWAHRLEHALPSLWLFHRAHHSDPDMSAATARRKSLGSVIIDFTLVSAPTLTICGTGVLDILSTAILFGSWGNFNHANIRLHLGPLPPIVSGPQLHRLHHGVAPEYHNCNYAAYFPIFDIVFGTYRAPRCDEYPETGVDDGLSFAAPELEVFSPALQRRTATADA